MALVKKQPAFSPQPQQNQAELILPVRSVFTGDLVTEGNARIDGTVNGNVTSEHGNILFGVDSKITGNVRGTDIATAGAVTGDISAIGQISIFAGASVAGNITANSLVVEADAYFEGHIKVGATKLGPTAKGEAAIRPEIGEKPYAKLAK